MDMKDLTQLNAGYRDWIAGLALMAVIAKYAAGLVALHGILVSRLGPMSTINPAEVAKTASQVGDEMSKNWGLG